MQRTVEITKVMTPSGYEKEFFGRDPNIWKFVREHPGSKITEIRFDLYKCTEEEFVKIAHYVKTLNIKKGE